MRLNGAEGKHLATCPGVLDGAVGLFRVLAEGGRDVDRVNAGTALGEQARVVAFTAAILRPVRLSTPDIRSKKAGVWKWSRESLRDLP